MNVERLLESFPQSDVEQKRGMSYIPHDKIRLRLIEATDNQFDWIVTNVEYRTDGVVKARTNRDTGEIAVPPVMIVTGILSIPDLGRRSGIGVQTLEAGSGEDMYKGAESDAFKRAAMSFGVALKQLYTDDGKPVPVEQTQPETILFMPKARKDAWIERIQGANELVGQDQQDTLNSLVKEAQIARNMEQIDLLVEHLRAYDNADKVAAYFRSKEMLSPKGEELIQARTSERSA